MTSSLKKVLIVDDEPPVLEMVSKALSLDYELYGVLTAESGTEALEILSREEVFLVVSDIKMPEISGLDLLTQIRADYPHIKVILMTGFGTEEIRSQVIKNGCLHFLEKPFSNSYLVELIREQVAFKNEGFAGTLRNIQLADLIQMCCLSCLSMGISVKKGSNKGVIYIEDGNIIHAECEDGVGEDAFYRILTWESGSFETMGAVTAQETTIDKNYQYLLLEAARMDDEKETKEDSLENEREEAPFLEETPFLLERDVIRVLIVDDSPMMCSILSDIFNDDKNIKVIGTAGNGEEALKKIGDLKPDLITLDVNMPIMDGSTALKHIMINSPCPVVIISSIGNSSQMNVLDFLCLGAVDFIKKPVKNEHFFKQKQQMVDKVRLAAKAKIKNFQRAKTLKLFHDKNDEPDRNLQCNCMVVVNSGAGGYAELIKTISFLPKDFNACLILLQTMPLEFVNSFTEYLDKRSRAHIIPLQNDSPVLGGRCYVGSSENLLKLKAMDHGYSLWIEDDDLQSRRQHGGIDSCFKSIAGCYPKDVLVVLMSGADVGDLDGLRSIKKRNGRIIAQNMNSCMVPCPLKKAIKADLVEQEASHAEIVRQIADS